jgi:asparagine synthetase B (glutamine-hydrolysing)
LRPSSSDYEQTLVSAPTLAEGRLVCTRPTWMRRPWHRGSKMLSGTTKRLPQRQWQGRWHRPGWPGLKVILAGEGSDERFAGYAGFGPDVVLEPDPSYPLSLIAEADRSKAWETECVNKGAASLSLEKALPRSRHNNKHAQPHLPAQLTAKPFYPFASWTNSYFDVPQKQLRPKLRRPTLRHHYEQMAPSTHIGISL